MSEEVTSCRHQASIYEEPIPILHSRFINITKIAAGQLFEPIQSKILVSQRFAPIRSLSLPLYRSQKLSKYNDN